ncbi:hypothetical protein FH508_0010880 [Lysinibacillus sp. CD3-6]|uniref:hypothetical protein n=1 Tax=Lysinibacillus sp. CD3-6 TaxID=2892541 RepID=UPI001168F0E1|nr:hypothetical protein [Lysinibacillus sp. CD3-6]UED82374.1 hypothetical protein FH508_0010880 [Lysinibacillus sp. CD3-6]
MKSGLKSKKRLKLYSANKSIVFVYIVLMLYFYNLLLSTKLVEGNIFDLLLHLTEFHPLFYSILPAFLMILISLFSLGNVQNYLLIRFYTKRQWYHANLLRVVKSATYFCLMLVAIMVLEAVFVLDFKNQWSNYSVHYYKHHTELLSNSTPIFLTTMSVVLLWLFLCFFGMLFYISYLFTGRILLACLVVLLVNMLNIGVFLSKITPISSYLFYDHINVFQYTTSSISDITDYPYTILLYWIVLIFILYLIGYCCINHKDMYIGERK